MNVWGTFVANLIELEGRTLSEDDVAKIIQWLAAVKKEHYKQGLKEGRRATLAELDRHIGKMQLS